MQELVLVVLLAATAPQKPPVTFEQWLEKCDKTPLGECTFIIEVPRPVEPKKPCWYTRHTRLRACEA